LSAWRSVSATSSKPPSRQYLRNGSTSKPISPPSGQDHDLALEVDAQSVADERGDLVEQLGDLVLREHDRQERRS
jgi:hypothetical protein